MKNWVLWKFLFGFIVIVCSAVPIGFGDQKESQVQLETKFVEVQGQNNRELGVRFRELEGANLNETRGLDTLDRIKDPMNNLRLINSVSTPGFGDDIGLNVIPKVDSANPHQIQLVAEPKVNTPIPFVPSSQPTQQTVIVNSQSTSDVKPENDKVPFLSSVPILGRLFKSKLESSNQKDLTVLITPHIVDPSGED